MKHYLFSFAAVAFTAVALGSIAYYTRPSMTEEEIQREEKFMQENIPPAPKVEQPVTIELPDTTPPAPKPAPVVRRSRPSPTVMAAKIEANKIPDLVCESEWHDSVLFAGGARYRNCKVK